jgi:hypothetical protein
MADSNDDDVKHVLSHAEYEALLKAPKELTLSTYQEALANKTLPFKGLFFPYFGNHSELFNNVLCGGLGCPLSLWLEFRAGRPSTSQTAVCPRLRYARNIARTAAAPTAPLYRGVLRSVDRNLLLCLGCQSVTRLRSGGG